MFALLRYHGKFELNKELLKLLSTEMESISKFFLIILTGIPHFSQASWYPICTTYLKLFCY